MAEQHSCVERGESTKFQTYAISSINVDSEFNDERVESRLHTLSEVEQDVKFWELNFNDATLTESTANARPFETENHKQHNHDENCSKSTVRMHNQKLINASQLRSSSSLMEEIGLHDEVAGTAQQIKDAQKSSSRHGTLPKEIITYKQSSYQTNARNVDGDVIIEDPDWSDPDTILKEKRGIVKRRSTSIVPLLNVQVGNEKDIGTDLNEPAVLVPEFASHGVQKSLTPSTVLYASQPQPDIPPSPLPNDLQLLEPRPSSSISNQDATLFQDFDGVHFVLGTAHGNDPGSINVDSKKNDSHIYNHTSNPTTTPLDKGMVYYPAPVPTMLNLPPKLSRGRPGELHKRRSTAFLGQQSVTRQPHASRQSMLLADVNIKDDSAVATLESLLDAAADAPPLSTVHQNATPKRTFQGDYHVDSSNIYTSQHQSLQLDQDLLTHATRTSNTAQSGIPSTADNNNDENVDDDDNINSDSRIKLGRNGETTYLKLPTALKVAPDKNNELVHPFNDVERGTYAEKTVNLSLSDENRAEDESEDEHEDVNLINPASLLVELEARKTRQRQRTKAAPLRYGAGLRSTLLELDAVAEVQRESRRKQPTTLAWQNNNNLMQDFAAANDDDVPLAVLFSKSIAAQQNEAVRAPGLLARREMEENEPLSKRRDRLKGLPTYDLNGRHMEKTKEFHREGLYSGASHMMEQQLPETQDIEDETLGERRLRLQAENKKVISSVGTVPITHDIEDESLAQRRQRLHEQSRYNIQESAIKLNHVTPSYVPTGTQLASTSNLLQSYPQRQSFPKNDRHVSNRGLLASELPNGYRAQQEQHQRLGMVQSTLQNGFQQNRMQSYIPTGPSLTYPALFPSHNYNASDWHGQGLNTYQYQNPLQQISKEQLDAQLSTVMADQKSREMIERWRTSVI